MTVKPMDALTSFQHVADCVHQWKASISDLAVYATKQHEMYVAEYTKVLHQARTKKRKSDSIVSIHSADDEIPPMNNDAVSKPPNAAELVDISPFEAGNRFIYAQAHRKRKPGTSLRSNGSESIKYRNKHMVVIYYDSHIQSELDKIVKSLGTARNNLRKGKNAYTVAKGFTLPNLNPRFEPPTSLTPRSTLKAGSQSSKSRCDSPLYKPVEPTTVDAAFPSTDKELEAVQSLCENAAHQILRDGDCKTELNSALEKMDIVLNFADIALNLLKTQQPKEDVAASYPTKSSSLSDHTSSVSTLCEKPSSDFINIHDKVTTPAIDALLARKSPPPIEQHGPPTVLAADAIEVDDDSSNESLAEMELNISNIRAATRARLVQ